MSKPLSSPTEYTNITVTLCTIYFGYYNALVGKFNTANGGSLIISTQILFI